MAKPQPPMETELVGNDQLFRTSSKSSCTVSEKLGYSIPKIGRIPCLNSFSFSLVLLLQDVH